MYSDTHRAESVADIQNAIARVLGFTREELAKNRQEQIAKTQIKPLLDHAAEPLRKALGAVIGWGVLVMAVHYFESSLPVYVRAYLDNKALGGSLMTGAGVVIALLAGFFKSVKTAIGVLLDVREAQVICLEGRLNTSRGTAKSTEGTDHPEASNEKYYYVIEDEYLPVSFEAFEAMQPHSGSPFRVYIAPRSKYLLSMEPMIRWHGQREISIWK